jgi:hypothetical protein
VKKFILIFAITVLVVFIVVFGFRFITNATLQKGALQVTSIPESKVYLDGKHIGNTPLCKCEAVDMLKPGNYTVRLVPENKDFSEFQEKITISSGVLTVVDRKFAKDSLSEGSVISLTPLKDKKKAELVVVSLPEGPRVFLDGSEIGKTPLLFENPTESDHILTVKKTGYKEKSVRIRTPLGYKLTVAVYLSTLTDLSLLQATQSAVLITPTPSVAVNTVLILDTPTGFLRVRENINGAEIARATPGETYELISEKSSWFEIKLKDGRTGWINSQYASKN